MVNVKIIITIIVGLLLAACGGGSENEESKATSPQQNKSENNFTISTQIDKHVRIHPQTAIVKPGAIATFEVTADAGYQINLIEGCSGALTNTTYKTAPINANCTISVTTVASLVAPEKKEQLSVVRLGYPGRIKLDLAEHDQTAIYNLYYAKESGVTNENYQHLRKGNVLKNVNFPIELPAAWNDFQNTYFIAEKVVGHVKSLSNEVTTTHQHIAGNWGRLCAVEGSSISCWGDTRYRSHKIIAQQPEIVDEIKQLAVGTVHQCSLSKVGVTCWGNSEDERLAVPELSDPSFIAIDGSTSCAIDSKGMKCWGENASAHNRVVLQNPKEVKLNDFSQNCAIDDSGIVCWDNYGNVKLKLPELKASHSLTISNRFACAISDNKVACWTKNGTPVELESIFKNPSQVTVNNASICVLDDTGVKCIGDQQHPGQNVPHLTNPRSIFSDDQYNCAIDDNGSHCWGRTEYIYNELPHLTNPTQVAFDSFTGENPLSCFADESGLECSSNSYGQVLFDKQYYPDDISLRDDNLCIVENGKLECFELVKEWSQEDPKIRLQARPTNLDSISNGSAARKSYLSWEGISVCALYTGGFLCDSDNSGADWNYPSMYFDNILSLDLSEDRICMVRGYQQINSRFVQCIKEGTHEELFVPGDLLTTKSVSVGAIETCVLELDRAVCWNRANDVYSKPLVNPTQLKVYTYQACAVDDNGLSCWPLGSNEGKGITLPSIQNVTKLMEDSTCAVGEDGLFCWDIFPYYGYGQRDRALY